MFLSTLAFLAILLPMAFFLARLLQGARKVPSAVAMLLAACWGAFLFLAHHEDVYSGLDTMAYGTMADAFAEGRPPVSRDTFLDSLPEAVADAAHYRPRRAPDGVPANRRTRDCAFELSGRAGRTLSRPFYIPAYSLAAAGSRLGRCFLPLLGALWTALLLLAAIRRNGLAALLPAGAILLATAYPAWFFRGDYAEAAGAILASAVWLSHSARPFRRPAAFAAAGFALGYSLAFHVTALLVATPIAFALFLESPKNRSRALLAGGIVGFAPLCLLPRLVCAPYGDWTHPTRLLRIAGAATEHAVLVAAALGLAALVAFAAAVGGTPRVRRVLRNASRRAGAWPWLVLALLPAVLLVAAPSPARQLLRQALPFAWGSLRAPALLLAALAAFAILRTPRRPGRALLFTLVSWAALVFLLVLGKEATANGGRPAGIWGFRRLLPPLLAFAALSARPLSNHFAAVAARGGRTRLALAAALAVAMVANPLRSPTAYFAVNGRGSEAGARRVAAVLDSFGAAPVVFDYFPHAAPFAASPSRRVIGLGVHARPHWPVIADWVADVARTGTAYVVSSYTLPTLEDGFALEPVACVDFTKMDVKARAFLDAVRVPNTLTNAFARAVPLDSPSSPPRAQSISFSGSPIGLRGDWLFTRKGDVWSRGTSGVVGPLPSPGTNVVAKFDVSWTPPRGGPSNQLVCVTFPGNLYLSVIRVAAGRHVVETAFVSDRPLAQVGPYTFASPTPFSPAAFGLKGYPDDLGVVFHSLTLTPQPAR